jgi:hypothetical protein
MKDREQRQGKHRRRRNGVRKGVRNEGGERRKRRKWKKQSNTSRDLKTAPATRQNGSKLFES